MDQIIIRYVDLPAKMKGFEKVDCNGDYNVYINANLGYYEQQKALDHELSHIMNGDFYNNDDISLIEAQ